MKNFLLLVVLVLSSHIIIAQQITADQLLEKAIQYHDPNNTWPQFNGQFTVTMETHSNSKRLSKIYINLPEEYFRVQATRDTIVTDYTLNKEDCSLTLNGASNLSEETLKANNMSCERAEMYKNYYTYLYGLPMKLKDPGTILDPTVEKKTFKGKEYLVLKATYDEAIGSDVWFFYFDPNTYAMEIYQFFKGDPNGKGKDTGEYILLTEEIVINNIRFPKNRAWYYNKDDTYLGTDFLNKM